MTISDQVHHNEMGHAVYAHDVLRTLNEHIP